MSVSEIPQVSGRNPITGNTIFHDAAKDGSLDLLYSIRDNMTEPYYSILAEKNNDGETCIHVAVKNHRGLLAINLVKVLVELGADINAQQESSLYTPLLLSVWLGDHELTEWLCQQPKIDWRAKNWDSMTVLDYAYILQDERMLVDILLPAVDADDGTDQESETSDENEETDRIYVTCTTTSTNKACRHSFDDL
ncbi:viral ankyrin 6 [Diadegma fenestrale ichnovirus]|nr:viral ankyrin 6 [Diadegma fenestrale ichnovirus]